jgi:hypothetical protein
MTKTTRKKEEETTKANGQVTKIGPTKKTPEQVRKATNALSLEEVTL